MIASVHYDSSDMIFEITPTNPDFITECLGIGVGASPTMSVWNNIVSSLIRSSIQIPGYWFAIVNPEDTTKDLLLVKDDRVLFNFLG